MNITVTIQPAGATPHGFAPIDLIQDGQKLCSLDLEYSAFSLLPKQSDSALDFLVVAAAVYVIDKLVLREDAKDAWTREIALSVPVKDTSKWNGVNADFARCLSFLTGDVWKLDFTRRQSTLVRPLPATKRRRAKPLIFPTGDTVSLFSGGLDSLAGVIDWLEANERKKLLLVGHRDADMKGPFTDQKALLEQLRIRYPARLHSILARVGHMDEGSEKTEITLRARSLIFIAMGMLASSALGTTVPLLIPENGTIALNVPLTPSRRGSCSTRTAHPHYLLMLSRVLAALELSNSISNPLRDKTKGEILTTCLNKTVLGSTARLSVSCAKRGHKKHFTRRTAKSCGRCMPCIYRRAAMHAAGWDNEIYGDDVCKGEVDVDAEGERSNDLRACFAFLNQKLTADNVAMLLMASGSLDPHGVAADAAMVLRTMDEIRSLFRAKGTEEMKRRAGVS
jgi:hypothetical protein